MKYCPRCKTKKSFDQFSFKNKEKAILSPYCKDCNKSYNKEHYILHKQTYIDKARAYELQYKRNIYEWIRNYCLNNPCVGCGENDFKVIHFDHIDPKQKNFEISKAIADCRSLKSIKNEIEQLCLPRCANCHLRRTAIQYNWYAMLR